MLEEQEEDNNIHETSMTISPMPSPSHLETLLSQDLPSLSSRRQLGAEIILDFLDEFNLFPKQSRALNQIYNDVLFRLRWKEVTIRKCEGLKGYFITCLKPPVLIQKKKRKLGDIDREVETTKDFDLFYVIYPTSAYVEYTGHEFEEIGKALKKIIENAKKESNSKRAKFIANPLPITSRPFTAAVNTDTPSLTPSSKPFSSSEIPYEICESVVMAVSGHDSSVSYYSLLNGLPTWKHDKAKRQKLQAGK